MSARRSLRSGIFWALFAAQVVHAEITPIPGPADARIRTAPYDANEVYRLYGFVGYDIALEFAKDETFQRVNGGDLKAITYSAQENTFTFKPRVRTVRMNLTVTTSKRRYYIEYSATDQAPESAGELAMYVVRFVYPPDPPEARKPTRAEEIETKLAAAQSARPRNFDYWFCGHPELKPDAAFDDGVQTRFTFAARAELPAIFLRNPDGSESLVNFTVQGDELIVHRVARQWILRRGRLGACIVNQSFSGAGEHLESGTLSRDVERASRVPRP
ncbi:MAG TPA: TrbG/VirB9 family P-type conjugative transfer protein [Polyangiaceae bacterium]|nr:TrbG/VirB9 family P-type conjugative transfer protein [Polyangiaceae bacterium]